MKETQDAPSMTVTHDPRQNHLLAALPAEIFERLQSSLQLVQLRLGEVLYEPGTAPCHVYFPITAIVALVYSMADRGSVETALVGNDGILGIELFMGGRTTPSRAVVQCPGYAYQLPGGVLTDEFNRAGSLQRLALRYTQALLTQMAQTAVCNRRHTLDQQLCRYLLLSLDRMPGRDLVMTQESIASMLGVRRESVTEVASDLQKIGLIKYRRGHISVVDRGGLEALACERYAIVKKESDRLIPGASSLGRRI